MIRLFARINQLYFKLFPIHTDFSPHVAEVKRPRNHVPLLTGVHGRELDCRFSTGVHIIQLLLPRGAVVIRVELFQPPQFLVQGVECVFVVLAVLVYYLGGAVVELLFDFVVGVEDFFEVLFAHIRVTNFVHNSFDCSFGCGVHKPHLDQHHVSCVR